MDEIMMRLILTVLWLAALAGVVFLLLLAIIAIVYLIGLSIDGWRSWS